VVRGMRLAIVCVLLMLSLILTACGTGITTRIETVVNAEGSGSRTLILSAPRSQAGSVDVTGTVASIKAAKPPFAQFKDESNPSTLRYLVSYTFKDPAEFSERASWFSSKSRMTRSGGLFAPTIRLTETFSGEQWFGWAIRAAKRESGDVYAIEYAATLPTAVENLTSEGGVRGSLYSAQLPSFEESVAVDFQSETRHEIASIAAATIVGADGSAQRTITYAMNAVDAAAIAKQQGGPDRVKPALEEWAGKGWTASVEDGSSGAEYRLTKKTASVSDLVIGDSTRSGPALETRAASNEYLVRRHYSESFEPSATTAGQVTPDKADYQVTFPWAIEKFDAAGSNVSQPTRSSLAWSGAGSDRLAISADLFEIRRGVLYPVVGGLLATTLAAILGLCISTRRIVRARV
jgi:hypothetical protein